MILIIIISNGKSTERKLIMSYIHIFDQIKNYNQKLITLCYRVKYYLVVVIFSNINIHRSSFQEPTPIHGTNSISRSGKVHMVNFYLTLFDDCLSCVVSGIFCIEHNDCKMNKFVRKIISKFYDNSTKTTEKFS